MYFHVQREQDNKAQITGTNSCPLSLNHTATDTNTMQCIEDDMERTGLSHIPRKKLY